VREAGAAKAGPARPRRIFSAATRFGGFVGRARWFASSPRPGGRVSTPRLWQIAVVLQM
jgi:hypothetical protein